MFLRNSIYSKNINFLIPKKINATNSILSNGTLDSYKKVKLTGNKSNFFKNPNSQSQEPSIPELHPNSLGAQFKRVMDKADRLRLTYSMY